MSRLMRRAETSRVAKSAVAVVTALSLVFMQTPVTWAVADQSAETANAVASNLEEITQTAVTEVGVSFDHAYIVYRDQVIAEPATKMTIPEGSELVFQVEPDTGYAVSSVVLTSGGAEQVLVADADGNYAVAADKLTGGASIAVSANLSNDDGTPAVVVAESGSADVADAAVVGGADAVAESAPADAVEEQAASEPVELTYSDDDVAVTATLASADVLPEGTVLVVTPVTKETEGYNYDAYMQALNESDSDADFTADNTLLYDIAFVADGVEVQPAEGAVKIDIQFKSKQLTDELNAESNGDVSVVHLPLTDEAKASVDSTAEAVEISSSDIKVEHLNATATIDNDNQAAEFTANSFSVYALTAGTVPQGALASEHDVTVSFTDTTGASATGPSGVYSLVMVLTHNGQKYYAISTGLDTSDVTTVDLSSQTFGELYNAGTASYEEGDSLTVFVASSDDGSGQLATWQIEQMAKGESAYGAMLYDNGSMIDNHFRVDITLFGAPAASVQTPVTTSAQSGGELSAMSTDTGWDGGASASDLFSGYQGEDPAPGADTYETILGNAVFFGIVTETFDLPFGDAQTNVAAKTGNCTEQTGNDFTNAVEQTFILANVPNVFKIKGYNAYVLTTPEAADRLVPLGGVEMTIDTSKTRGELEDAVQGMIDHATAQSQLLASRADTAQLTYNQGDQKYYVDLTDKGAGTYYVTLDGTAYNNICQSDKLRISKNADQTIVFNVTGNPTEMQKYSINGSGSDTFYNKTDEASEMNRTVVWNFVNANGNINIAGSVNGVVLAPKATVTVSGTSAGWLIAKNVNIGSGEWHNVDQKARVLRVGSAVSLKSEKRVNGTAAEVSGFEFELFAKDGEGWTSLGSVQNDGSAVEFPEMRYSAENFTSSGNSQEHLYKLVEKRDPKTIDGTTYTADTTEYYAKVTVNKVTTQKGETKTISYNADAPVYYSDEACEHPLAGLPAFNNTTTSERHATGSATIEATKVLTGASLADGAFSFELKDSDGNVLETARNDAQGDIAFGPIPYTLESLGGETSKTFTYTISEVVPSDTNGVKYDTHIETVTVTVSDDGSENLVVTTTYDNDGAKFENEYDASGSVQIKAHKQLAGQTLEAGAFSFVLTGPKGVEKTASNAANGDVVFDAIDYKLSDLDLDQRDSDGRAFTEITYTVAEVVPGDASVVTTDDMAIANGLTYDNKAKSVTVRITDMGDGTLRTTYTDPDFTALTFNNKYETVDIRGTKVWSDDDNRDAVRPSSVTVRVMADGVPTETTQTVSGDMSVNSWNFSFNDLPKYGANGNEIAYSVTEEPVEGYTTGPIIGTMSTGFTITNTHTSETTSINAQKEWVDEGDQSNRPEKVTFQLRADGVNYRPAQTVSASEGWKAEWTGLPKYRNVNGEAKEIVYDVVETNVPDGYEATYGGDAENGFVVTNTLKPGVTSVRVTKSWADEANHDKIRPASINVQLKADGNNVGEAVALSGEGDNWTYEWTDLPKYKDGKTIAYTVEEVGVPSGYTMQVTGNASSGYVITNTHEKKTTSVSVEKKWVDDDNHDGLRPNSVQVKLMNGDQQVGDPITLSGDEWSYTWTGLDAIDSQTGDAIRYTIQEIDVPAYTATYEQVESAEGTFSYVVTNTHKTEVVDAKVTKIWEDDDNRDGVRPPSVTVKLKANDKDVPDSSVTLSEENSWTGTWENLDKLSGGEAIKYEVVEDAVFGYTASYGAMQVLEDGTYAFTVTNSHENVETSVSVKKVWNDDNNRDGIRPESVRVELLADGTPVANSEVVLGNGSWTHTWDKLVKYRDNGTEIEYTVREVEVPEGYSVGYSGDDQSELVVTNTHETDKTSASVTKEWSDSDNRDGVRPESVTVQLMADDQPYGDPVVLKDRAWTHEWKDLPANKNVDGQVSKVKYDLVETETGGYDPDVKLTRGDGENGAWQFTLTNTYNALETSMTVIKDWDDDDNRDGVRPESVTVQLKADGQPYGDTVELKDGNWSHTWTGLPAKANGEDIEYTVEELNVEALEEIGYTSETVPGEGNSYRIVNSYETQKTDITVTKAWDDDDDRELVRPEKVAVNLLANGEIKDTVELTGDTWSATWEDQPKYENGKLIEYSVKEAVPAKYELVAIEEGPSYSFTITNKHEIETVSVSVAKSWDDDNDRDAIRPNEVRVKLLADSVEVDEQVLNSGNGWGYVWNAQPKFDGEDEIVYTVEESSTAAGYGNPEIIVKKTGGYDYEYVVVNKHEVETTEASVQKVWKDNGNSDGVRPQSIGVQLLADGEPYGAAVPLTGAAWSHKWTDLPANKNVDGAAVPIVYTIEELGKIGDYETQVGTLPDNVFVITNERNFAKTSVSVTKQWEDDDNADGKRPDSVTVQLYADNVKVDEPVILDAEHNWTGLWTGLAKNKLVDGRPTPIEYTVKEVDLPDGYADSYNFSQGEDGSFVWTAVNTLQTEKTNVTVHKTWSDDDNRDKVRPESVQVQLRANGSSVGEAVTLNAENGWEHSWPVLPKNKLVNGESTQIEYSVVETSTDPNYEPKVEMTGDAESGFKFEITNTHTPESTSVSVVKDWRDENDRDGIRPTSVTVQLKADGAVQGNPVTLNADNEWAYTWSGLNKNENGREIVYTVEELRTQELESLGYRAEVQKNGSTFTVVNTHDVSMTEATATKKWEDGENQDGTRPDKVTLTLYADGDAIASHEVKADDNGDWAYTFTNLKEFRDHGIPIVYTIGEDVSGLPVDAEYESTVNEDNALTVINSRNVDTIDINGKKQWTDGENQDGTRPDKITVVLKDGETVVAQQETSAEDNWAYSFTDLEKNRDGQPINYTVDEVEVPGYTTTVEGYDLKNTLDVGHLEVSKSVENVTTTKSFTFTVTLSDDKVNGQHGDMLFENGVATFTLSDGNTATAVNLPAGIDYTVTEQAPDGFTATATNGEGTIAKNQVAKVGFTNTYKATGQAVFKATKNLEGRTLNSNEFQFVVEENGNVVRIAGNVGNDVTFEPIAYEYTGQPITHEYTIHEVVPAEGADKKGVEYDTTVYTVRVTASDNGDGTLKIDYDYGEGFDAEAGMVFSNKYATEGKAVLKAHKSLTGMDLVDNQFTFELTGVGIDQPVRVKNDARGDVAFPEITFTKEGTYNYTIKELHPDMAKKDGENWVYNGMTYDGREIGVTVTATDNRDGTMKIDVVYANGGTAAEFVNSYQAKGTFNLSATKKMEGREFQEGDSFTFEVTAPDGTPMPEKTVETITPTEGTLAVVDFGTIQYEMKDKGKTYTYTVRETGSENHGSVTPDTFAHTVTVTLTDKLDGTFDVQTEYSDGDSMVLTNRYAATGEARLFAQKTLVGRQMKDKEFSFELTGDKIEDKYRVPATLVGEGEGAHGIAQFPTISFDQNDVGKKFTYHIKEVVPEKTYGVKYDTHVETVEISVADNGDGTLAITYDGKPEYEGALFANEYAADDVTVDLGAEKILSGGTVADGQFSFTLTGTSENTQGVSQTIQNDASGKVAFDPITYTAPGVYEYEIKEVVPAGGVDNGDGTVRLGTVVYDNTAHKATVTVTDDGLGALVADVVYDIDNPDLRAPELTITNGIQLASTGFEFDKYFFGGSGSFDFVLAAADAQGNVRTGDAADYRINDQGELYLADSDADKLELVDNGEDAFTVTVKNGAFANGHSKVTFPKIQFADDGDYYYLVSEAESDDASMMTDEASYLVHVTVEGGDVTDTAYELIYDGKNYGPTTDLSFYNNSTVTLGFGSISAQSYTGFAQKTSVYPEVKKYLNGSTDRLVGGEFQFELSGDTLAKPVVATNDETGDVAFYDEEESEGLVFTEAGTYRYTIREIQGNDPNVTYDESEITLTVTVTDTPDGLVAEASYGGAVGAGEEPAFYNTVEGMDLTVQKVSRYGGEGLVDCTYALWMVADGGDVMIQEAISDENGFITFKDVNLVQGARYYFKEVEAPKGHTVDPYRTAYFSLTEDGTALELVEETAADGWHSKYDNIELDKAKAQDASEGSE